MREYRIAVIIPARREKDNLIKSIMSIQHQRGPFKILIYVIDDGLDEDIIKQIRKSNVAIIKNPIEHDESWAGKPYLAYVLNLGLSRIYELGYDIDYIMFSGADTVYPSDYLLKIVNEMSKDRKLVIASGVIYGEPSEDLPRGSGRVIKYKWWHNKIRFFPLIYGWEAYPIYVALAHGYKVKVVKEAKMYVLRPTKQVKPEYGYAMRALGYFTPYAILRIIGMLRYSRVNAIRVLTNYIRYRKGVYDIKVGNFLKYYQSRKILRIILNILP